MTNVFETINVDDMIQGVDFEVSRESIRLFCDASLDYNPLHLDDNYMKGDFGKTTFGGIIMHGMNNFGIITRMLTDWGHENGGFQKRLETRWLQPVFPGDVIRPEARIKIKKKTDKSRWIVADILVKNQKGEPVTKGEALLEFPEN